MTLFDRAQVTARTQALAHETPALDWITDGRVDRLSQDFNWFSPVLKRQLGALRADAVVRPRTEDEVRTVVSQCARAGVPITLRGSGTGNYGQCVPLHGGVVLDLSGYNQLLWVRPGVARAQAGIRLIDIDRSAQPQGWELRCVPSTFRSATLGGLFGGGFGGVGSINHGPLAAPGNVLGVRVMSVEPEPRVLELRAPEAMLLHHAYGCNGVVLEVEAGLAPAHPWLELVVSFDDFDTALACADAVALAPGLVKKSVTLFEQPVSDLLRQGVPVLAGAMDGRCHTLVLLVAEWSEPALLTMLQAAGGRVVQRRAADEVRSSQRTIVETTWNHTTLHAMKVDKTLTYLQTAYPPGPHLQHVKALHAALGDEVLLHLEWIRNRDGLVHCTGLPLVRYRSDERLDEIIRIHREQGVTINNPHVHVVEDGKQARINPAVVDMKMRLDPAGLLNPGKLRGWDQRPPADSNATLEATPC